ncbi:MAG TPA: MBL fold metallo-hydrolase [Armatimonadota bacterium]
MRVTLLGTGTSFGVPMIACHCAVCTSANPRNRRTRSSVWVEHQGTSIVVDTTPEFRLQSLAAGIERIDAVLFTHSHADHVFGLDDVRRFNHLQKQEMPVYADERTLEDLRRVYRYVFVDTQAGGGKPQLALNAVRPEFRVGSVPVRSFTVMHGELPIRGYRFGGFAYVTDCSSLPPESKEQLQGLDLLVLTALRRRPHPTHFSVEQALATVEELRPKRALFTHIAHDLEHEELCRELPDGVDLAYDGQIVELDQ